MACCKTKEPQHAVQVGMVPTGHDFGIVVEVREMVVLFIHIERRVPDGGDRGKRRGAIDDGDGSSSHKDTIVPWHILSLWSCVPGIIIYYFCE